MLLLLLLLLILRLHLLLLLILLLFVALYARIHARYSHDNKMELIKLITTTRTTEPITSRSEPNALQTFGWQRHDTKQIRCPRCRRSGLIAISKKGEYANRLSALAENGRESA